MIKVLLPVAALLVSIGPVSAGLGLTSTEIGVRLAMGHAPALLVSLVLTGYPLGFLVGCFSVRSLIEAVGPVRSFAAFGGLLTATTLGFALAGEPLVWGVLRLAGGFCASGLYVVTESWLNARATAATRGGVLAAYMVTDKLAYTGGQALFGMGDPLTTQLFVTAALLFSLSLVPLSISRVEAPLPPGRGSRYGIVTLFRVSPIAVVAAACSGSANSASLNVGSTFASALGFDQAHIAGFMAAILLGGLSLQWPIGWLSDRIDRRVVLAGAVVGSGVCALGMALVGHAPLTLSIMGFLFGGAAFVVYPLAIGHANDKITSDKVVAVSAGLLMSWAVGAVTGPLLGSQAMAWLGPSGLFYFVALVYILLAAFVIIRIRQYKTVSGQPGPFVAMPQTTPAVSPLNPRGAGE